MKTIPARLSLEAPTAAVRRDPSHALACLRRRQFEMILRNELSRKAARRVVV